jgi:SAM-dependent methyltransferase
MTTGSAHPDYLLHSDREMLRLERQAAIYGSDDDLAALALAPTDRVLEVGCGAGVITRTIAKAVPGGTAVGVDREARYVEHARRRAIEDGASNLAFEIGDALSLPFPDASFDMVWSKHVLQWIGERERAIAEMVRVVRPGGRVVAANFDGFLTEHWPRDDRLHSEIERWFGRARDMMGFDGDVGRKLPAMFVRAGLVDVRVHTMPDRAFSGLGGDPERQWNHGVQLEATLPVTTAVFGSEASALDFNRRFLERFGDPAVYWHCTMFYVEGRRPR